MQRGNGGDTRARVLAAAAELFAAHGFHGTTARDIAARARVNLAAGNYHFGSKRDLYLEVLRGQFAEIRALLARRGASKPPSEVQRMSRRGIEGLLQTRSQAMLDLLIGPPPGLHGTLMQREMTDPSEALPVIVDEFILPMMEEMKTILAPLAPNLAAVTIERCVHSIMGQALFYRFVMPAMLRVLDRRTYPRGFARTLAKHITQFSLGGIDRLAAPQRRSHHAR
ncbi:MAG: CerR family C-terminal domain-containing protein [Deltaproteobacteria bacterium]|nr:CerR family C-terminal domain-containing protein [Deltaproteobacteria bacterium]MBI3387227.1 CerR family C-terminal domain-containing protein [Deltaproteobacteria bacterium]